MVPREREGGAFVYFRAPPTFVLQVLRNLSDKDGRSRHPSGNCEAVEEPKVEKSSVATARGVLWVANVYPTKVFRFDFRQMLTHHNHETLIPQLLPDGVEA
ncbi:hypothetical protein AK812_SmicGene45917, partial [Symbiodinium microadriaticum]